MSEPIYTAERRVLHLRPEITSPREFGAFCLRVLKGFFQHNGLILAGAIAYNTLLSIIPLFGILLLFLSRFVEQKRLLIIIEENIRMWLPGYSQLLTDQVKNLLDHPEAFGGLGLLVLLFFSSIAFSVMSKSIQEIFGQQRAKKRRAWLSVLLPYMYILVIGLVLVFLLVTQNIIGYVSAKTLALWGVSIEGAMGLIWSGLVFVLMVCLIASLYAVMPGGYVSFRRSLIGGLSAALLWEVVRRILMWYFTNISMVNVIYGSFGAVIVVLLCFEVAAIIFLLGAEVIAEWERGTLPLPDGPAEEAPPPPSELASA